MIVTLQSNLNRRRMQLHALSTGCLDIKLTTENAEEAVLITLSEIEVKILRAFLSTQARFSTD